MGPSRLPPIVLHSFVIGDSAKIIAFAVFVYYLVSYRARIRALLGIAGHAWEDCCTVFCCLGCTLCQLARTLDAYLPPTPKSLPPLPAFLEEDMPRHHIPHPPPTASTYVAPPPLYTPPTF
eukprot:TRINITY_DN1134_c0_g1_i15.p1 TRINITY_DN1134_c0_g1~~TRINITY_DN1134_c0_g1_i15.p1  ORF type:complete len:121 (+),score=18.76 TRINITY_DN1134_c0_g1_i15:488-850(+)